MRLSDEWQIHALCRGNHAHLFFPPSHFERKEDRERREVRAVAICNVCPVKQDCREYSLKVGEVYGIWGGMTELERRDEFGVVVAIG